MASPSSSGVFQVGINVLNSVIDKVTGTVLFITGDVASQTPEADNVEAWGQLGVLSRPSNPAPGKAAAECITIRRGDRDVAICARDQRGQLLSGNLQPGETCLYAGGADGSAQGRVLLKATGAVSIYTTKGNVAGGAGMGIFVNPDGSVSVLSHTGAAFTIGADGSVKVFNKAGAIQVMPDGTVKIGSTKAIAIAAPNVTVGSAAQPLVTQAGLAAALTAIGTAMTAIGVGSAANGATGASSLAAAASALTSAPPNITKSFQAS